MPLSLPTPGLEFFADLSVQVAAPIEVGHTPHGLRRVIPITGGEVQGEPGHLGEHHQGAGVG